MDISLNLRTLRRSIAGLSMLALLVTMSFAGVAKAQTYSDVTSSDWYYEYVEDLSDQGVVSGSDGEYRPADYLNRAEAAKLMVLGYVGEDELDEDYDAGFTDVEEDAWYASYVNTAAKLGIVEGYTDEEGELTGEYGPSDYITRAAFAKMVVNAAGLEEDTTDAPHFSDVEDGAWYYEFVETAYNNGVVSGYSDGTYKPGDNVNRAESSKMIYLGQNPELIYDEEEEEEIECDDGYTLDEDTETCLDEDGCEADTEYNEEAEACVEVCEDDYTYDVDEGACLDDSGCESGYTLDEDTAVCLDEDGCESGTEYNEDAAACVEVCEDGYEYDVDEEACVEEEEEVAASTATLTVEMGDAVTGATVPKGATSVDMLNVTFTASGDATELDGFTVHRTGVGSSSDFSYLYLYDGDTRLTTGRTIASDDNEATFGSLNLELADGESITLTVVGDIATGATTGDENAVEITSAEKIDSDAAEVSGTFSLTGETFTISGASTGTVTVEKTGSIPNPTIGEEDAEIAEFKLTISSSEDVALQRITLTLKGTIAQEAFSDLQLIQGSDVVATADSVSDDDIATFVINDTYGCDDYGYTDLGYCIGKGNSKTFSLTADIGATADPDDTIKVYLDESTDLEAEGLVYGYGAQVTYTTAGTGYDGTECNNDAVDDDSDGSTADECSYSVVQGGQFTISQDGPIATDVAINAKDVILSSMTFNSERNVEVKKLTGSYTATGSGLTDGLVRNFTDFKLVLLDDDGEVSTTLMGPSELGTLTDGSDTQTIDYTDAWTMSADEEVTVALTCDIANYSSLADSTITATLSAVSTTEGIKDTDTNEYITDIVPSSAIAGNAMTVKAASLAVSLASTPTSDTFVKGTEGINLATFAFSVGSAMDVNVSQIVLAGYLAEDGDDDYTQGTDGATNVKNVVTTVWLEDSEGVQIGDDKAFSSGDATFSSLDWDIEAGDTELVYVYGDVSSSAPFTGSTNQVYVDIDAAADITLTDAEGNTVDATGDNTNGTEDSPNVTMTISAGGTLTIAEATSSLVSSQIQACGTQEVLVGKFKLSAVDEDFEVKIMTFTATGDVNGTAQAAAPQTLKRDIANLKLKYPDDLADPDTLDGEEEEAMAGSNVSFNDLGLFVPKDDYVYVELYADFNSHNLETGGAYSDDELQFVLNTGDVDGNVYGNFEAVGQGSGTGYVESEISDIVLSNSTYLYRSVPTVANDTSLSSSLIASADSEVYQFTVESTSATEDLILMFLTLDVSPTGLVTGGTANSLTNLDDNPTFASGLCLGTADYSTAPWFIEDGNGDVVGTGCYDSLNGLAKFDMTHVNSSTVTSGTEISSTAKTFTVKADIYVDTDTSTTESLSIRIHNDTTYVAAADLTSIKSTSQTNEAVTGMIWSDRGYANGVDGEDTDEYMTGYKVDGMPVSYMTLT